MVLHLAISLISSSLIHLVDFLDPPINFYFLRLNLILKLMVAGLLLLLHLHTAFLHYILPFCSAPCSQDLHRLTVLDAFGSVREFVDDGGYKKFSQKKQSIRL